MAIQFADRRKQTSKPGRSTPHHAPVLETNPGDGCVARHLEAEALVYLHILRTLIGIWMGLIPLAGLRGEDTGARKTAIGKVQFGCND